ncbi:MAG: hypothetical protein HY691_15910 [Chloroflexi bacterium]|nr:hypothetical protein [Chloroflexota bacterium]
MRRAPGTSASPQLDPAEVRRWLRGQRVAARRIERERRAALAKLTSEEALRIYLSLHASAESAARAPAEPSPVLWRMRQMLAELARRHAAGS